MVGARWAALDSTTPNLGVSLPIMGRAYAIESHQASIRGEHHD